MCFREFVKIVVKPDTQEKLEEITGLKLSRNGDQVIQKVVEIAEDNKENSNEIDILVCDQTEKFAGDEEN